MFEVMIKMWKILFPRLIAACSRAELSGAVYGVSTSISRFACCASTVPFSPHVSFDMCNDMKNIQPLLCVFCTRLVAIYVSRHVCGDTYVCAFNSLVAFPLRFLVSSRLLSLPALICVRPSVFFSHYPASCMCLQPWRGNKTPPLVAALPRFRVTIKMCAL